MKAVTGKIISDKMAKTAVVEVTRFIVHPIYQKRMRRTSKFHAVNEMGAKIGQMVEMTEIRPISKLTNWKITKIIK